MTTPYTRRLTATLTLALLAAPAAAQETPTLEQLRQEVAQEVASLQGLSQEMVDMVFSLSELGFQEHWTVEYLTGVLRDEGFTVNSRLAPELPQAA